MVVAGVWRVLSFLKEVPKRARSPDARGWPGDTVRCERRPPASVPSMAAGFVCRRSRARESLASKDTNE